VSGASRELITAARAAARAAAALLRDARPERLKSKSNPRDLVTEWDVRSEELIREVLAEHAPGVPVIGEEGGGALETDRVHWLVDPIDGTVNFAHGLPLWCVSIAAAQAGDVLAGVVATPLLDERWWFEAEAGHGARDGTGAPLAVSTIDRLDRAMLSTGFPYDMTGDNNLARWSHLMRTAGTCRRLGSAAIDLCLVARGAFDGHWESSLNAWDLAAGVLIIREAGGTVTNLTGGPFGLHTGQVLATNGAIHNELIAELARAQEPS
jgi:myo-inositol-1(or 4)-monophosphatase